MTNDRSVRVQEGRVFHFRERIWRVTTTNRNIQGEISC